LPAAKAGLIALASGSQAVISLSACSWTLQVRPRRRPRGEFGEQFIPSTDESRARREALDLAGSVVRDRLTARELI
jgi:hypothetical protein